MRAGFGECVREPVRVNACLAETSEWVRKWVEPSDEVARERVGKLKKEAVRLSEDLKHNGVSKWALVQVSKNVRAADGGASK